MSSADDYLKLANKTAIVTGAGAQLTGVGNGRAAATLLADAGAHVVLVDLVADRMEETARMIEDRGGTSISIAADVSDPGDCERVVTTAIEQWGRLDVLVNNVGVVGPAESVVDVDVDAWTRCFAINVNSVMLMSKFAIPHMASGGGGSIVNVTSLAAIISHPRPAYTASKAAVIGLTNSMASVHGADGIRVNAVAPGMVYTPNVQVEGVSEAARADRAAASPLGIEGTGWDIGDAIVYLASARARWVTGQCIVVDGGFSVDLRVSDGSVFTAKAQQER